LLRDYTKEPSNGKGERRAISRAGAQVRRAFCGAEALRQQRGRGEISLYLTVEHVRHVVRDDAHGA